MLNGESEPSCHADAYSIINRMFGRATLTVAPEDLAETFGLTEIPNLTAQLPTSTERARCVSPMTSIWWRDP